MGNYGKLCCICSQSAFPIRYGNQQLYLLLCLLYENIPKLCLPYSSPSHISSILHNTRPLLNYFVSVCYSNPPLVGSFPLAADNMQLHADTIGLGECSIQTFEHNIQVLEIDKKQRTRITLLLLMIDRMTLFFLLGAIYTVIITIIYKTRTFMRWHVTTSFCVTFKR